MTMMLADIATGNTGFADVMFLVAFILFLLAAILLYPRGPENPPYGTVVATLGLAAFALGWLVL
jgi:hypothetical protein